MIGNRVQQTSTTVGTGSYSLTGSVANRNTFIGAPPNGFPTGSQVYYLAEENGVGWEIGIGTVTDLATDTLSRDTILGSSNGGLAVNWGVGTRQIACLPASELLGAMGGRLTIGTVGGSANAITVATPVPLRTLTDGAEIAWIQGSDSSGAITLNGDGTGAVSLRNSVGTAFDAGNILKAGQFCVARYKASTGFWHLVSALAPAPRPGLDTKTGAYTVVDADFDKEIRWTTAGVNANLTAAATLGAGFRVTLVNAAGSGDVTIDPAGSETLDGQATRLLRPGDRVTILCDGSNWVTLRGSYSFTSAETAVAASTVSTLAHGPGVIPTRWRMVLRCKTAELGYSIGNEVGYGGSYADQASTAAGASIVVDETNCTILTGSILAKVQNKGSAGGAVAITAGNWRWEVRAFDDFV